MPNFRCRVCQRKFNEHTGTPFNHLKFPTDIVFQILLCRFRYQLSLRNVAELFLLRGFEFTQEAAWEWEARFVLLFAKQLRRRRQGKIGSRWYVDETYLKVKSRWCYLYRAIDHDSNLVDSMLSSTRDMTAAQRLFQSTLSIRRQAPQQVTTDGHDSYPRAIQEVLGLEVKHRNNAYLNRRIEQDHRGIKQRYHPILDFGAFLSAQTPLWHIRRTPTIFPSSPETKAVRLPPSWPAAIYQEGACVAVDLSRGVTHSSVRVTTIHHPLRRPVPPVLTLSSRSGRNRHTRRRRDIPEFGPR